MEDWQEKEFKEQEMLNRAVEGADRIIIKAADGNRERLAYYTVRVAQRFLDKIECMVQADVRRMEMMARIEAPQGNEEHDAGFKVDLPKED